MYFAQAAGDFAIQYFYIWRGVSSSLWKKNEEPMCRTQLLSSLSCVIPSAMGILLSP